MTCTMESNAKRFKRAPLVAAIGAAMGLIAAGAVHAEVVVGNQAGWELSFDGSVNAFLVTENPDATPANVNGGTISDDQSSSRIRTGLLPAVFAFNVRTPTTNGLKGAARFGFYPQIQNANTKNAFGSQLDLRQAYFTVDGNFGQVMAGRNISLFLGKNILTDMTLFGVGVEGGVSGGGTTLGRIGYGYVYPQFNAQIRYTTPDMNGFKLAVGAFDPSQIASAGVAATQTKTPRFEGELSWVTNPNPNNKIEAWVNGMTQKADFTPGSGFSGSVTANGVGGGVQWTINNWSLLASGYTGKALGTTLMLDTDSLDPTGKERDDKGYLAQVTFNPIPSTKIGVSYGLSQADETSAEQAIRLGGGVAQLNKQKSTTVGVYHDINSWLKVVAEYTTAKNEWFNGASQKTNIVSVGTFFSF